MRKEYDYIIVGAGSAGCVLASELSRDRDTRVLIVEAGRGDWSPMIHMPAGIQSLIEGTAHNWAFRTVPQKHLNNRRMFIPQGKAIGGTSSINGMIYIRGSRQDYEKWAAEGCTGWGYQDVLPVFKRLEANTRIRDEYHGNDGPLNVTDFTYLNPLTATFLEACDEIGLPRNKDFNGATQFGAGHFQYTVKDGRRMSAARAFLHPARKSRPNLDVYANTLVSRIVVENGRAVGIELVGNDRRATTIRATREVIVSSGALNSPKLLLLSGIGPAAELKQAGVKAIHDLPGVGKGLQDHLDAAAIWHASTRLTYDDAARFPYKYMHGARYLLLRSGPVTSSGCEAVAYTKSEPGLSEPDVSVHFLPAWVINHGFTKPPGHGITLHNNNMRPVSRGEVKLASADPLDAPLIDPNFMADPFDVKKMIGCVKIGREIMETKAFRPYVSRPYAPLADVRTDEQIVEFVRQTAETDYHPVGSCRMGVDDLATVDPRLRVRGLDGLRVVDSSIMPHLIGGNTNAASIMIGAKGSDMILEDNDGGSRPPADQRSRSVMAADGAA
ncbi:GMC family oxidoreductase [Labrys wisconsinensis]|uniref:Choline dehydrogenase-like flavoprotein n=1 Tax=Labrys wisconsinensis TaxID=425677 RepID=A0ABU0JIY0_9HYPH|nr:choline dehydrogenase [Labrys wisconsinensis]MDQ0474247.1 choline dehydrogenase-like flavoprotein [Labrys wisconsinensis]